MQDMQLGRVDELECVWILILLVQMLQRASIMMAAISISLAGCGHHHHGVNLQAGACEVNVQPLILSRRFSMAEHIIIQGRGVLIVILDMMQVAPWYHDAPMNLSSCIVQRLHDLCLQHAHVYRYLWWTVPPGRRRHGLVHCIRQCVLSSGSALWQWAILNTGELKHGMLDSADVCF